MPPTLHHRRQIPEWIASIDHLPVDDEPFAFRVRPAPQTGQHVVPFQVAVHQRLDAPTVVQFIKMASQQAVVLQQVQELFVLRTQKARSLINMKRQNPGSLTQQTFSGHRRENGITFSSPERGDRRSKLTH